MWGEFALSIQSGNYYMFAILGLAFLSSVLIIERYVMLQFVYNIDFAKFISNLKKMVSSEDLERAISFCKSVSSTSLAKIALKALEAAENDPTTVRGVIEEDTIDFLPRVENRIGILPSMATMVMLVGVLGTIDGLWQAFHSIDVLDTAKKQASLANGVAGSLNPTAIGLIVCMLILFFHQLLKGLALKITERIHFGTAVLHNLLVPQDVATAFVAAPGGAGGGMGGMGGMGGGGGPAPLSDVMEAAPAAAAPSPDEGGASDDAFEDASVEDIKDEEEII